MENHWRVLKSTLSKINIASPAVVLFLLWQNIYKRKLTILDILKYVYTIFCLSIHQLMGTWVVSTFWLVWIMPVWTLVYKYLFGFLFSILLGIYPGVELLSLMVILCLSFWRTIDYFCIAAEPFYLPTCNAQAFQSTSSPTPVFHFKKNNSHPAGYEVVPHCSFYLLFSNN